MSKYRSLPSGHFLIPEEAASPVAQMVESACNAGDLDLIPGSEDPLEKGMATHSSILAWRIPWTGDLGGL